MEWQLGSRHPHHSINPGEFISRVSGDDLELLTINSSPEFRVGEKDLVLATAELLSKEPDQVLEILGGAIFDSSNIKNSYNPFFLKQDFSFRIIDNRVEILGGTPDNLDRSWSPMILTKGRDGLYWCAYQVLTGSTARNAFETAPIYKNCFDKAWAIIKNPSLLLLFFNYSVSSSIANSVVETARMVGFEFVDMKIERWSGNRWCFHFGFRAPSDIHAIQQYVLSTSSSITK